MESHRIKLALLSTTEPSEEWVRGVLRRVIEPSSVSLEALEASRSNPNLCDVLLVPCPADRAVELVRQVRNCIGDAGLIAFSEGSPREAPVILQAGADIWLPVRSSPALVLGFLSSIVRRLMSDWSPHGGAIFLSAENHTVRIGTFVAKMRRTEFKVCEYLILNRGRWVAERELLRVVLEMRHERTTSLVRVHMRHIRKALGPYAPCVCSKRGIGYRFVASAIESQAFTSLSPDPGQTAAVGLPTTEVSADDAQAAVNGTLWM
jgi:DNA-binding response OmpR family regulator